MLMRGAGGWHLMSMAQGFLVDTQQSGPRGADRLYSTNWGMFAAMRGVGKGSLMLRGMASLEPLTVRQRQYPLLFQTGETVYGKPLVDGQHPHELLMELSVHYARPISSKVLMNLYYAPVGDAALGPVAFPHRASAMEIPQAALGHHWQDATHIANSVVTAGFTSGAYRIEASGFRGREPNENRWNIDMGRIDSWSTRFIWQPTPNLAAQASGGRIKKPEATHADDVVRTTASLHYTQRDWSSSLIWSRNYKTDSKHATTALLAETVVPITRKNLVVGRAEWSQRDELLEHQHEAFAVASFTGGYTRELGAMNKVRLAAGFNFTAYDIASELKPIYGRNPKAASIFIRLRLAQPDTH